MNDGEIRKLIAYNDWANRQLFAAAGRLSSEEFGRDRQTSHSSVRGTMVHIVGGHWAWLRLWIGEPAIEIAARCDALWDPARFPDVAALEIAYDGIEREQRSLVDSLTDERVNNRITFQNFQGEEWALSLGEMVQHVVNHSTYHRGQVVTLLRQSGQVPPGTDLSTFLVKGAAA